MTADPADLHDPDNWLGGFYELAIELGERDDLRLDRALRSMWRVAGVRGCFTRGLQPVNCGLQALQTDGHLRGVVRIPYLHDAVCGAVAIRFEDGPDCLAFYIPEGALRRLEPRVGGYPFAPDTRPSLVWRTPLDEWLVGIARSIYLDVEFRLALVGFECVDDHTASELEATGIPDRRCAGILRPESGVLRYHAATV